MVSERRGFAIRQLEQAAAHDANRAARAGARGDTLPRCVGLSELRRDSTGGRLEVDFDRRRLQTGRLRRDVGDPIALRQVRRRPQIAASSAAGVSGSSTRQPGAGAGAPGDGACNSTNGSAPRRRIVIR